MGRFIPLVIGHARFACSAALAGGVGATQCTGLDLDRRPVLGSTGFGWPCVRPGGKELIILRRIPIARQNDGSVNCR